MTSDRQALESGRTWLLERLENGMHPLDGLDRAQAEDVIRGLQGLDPEPWTQAWLGASKRFEDQAAASGDAVASREALEQAYGFAFLARYPVTSHPLKHEAYDRARDLFVRAADTGDHPFEVVTLPFEGRDGDADSIRFYVVRPRGVERPPVVMGWGGIDTWKEEVYSRLLLLLERGFALLLIDMPGVGESPVLASADAERQWEPVFEWLRRQDDLDADRCAALGLSFGGYWAMKLAYVYPDHLCGAVNWGGGVHITFTPEWQARSRNASSYLMDLMVARARIFGGSTFEDYVARCPELSLLTQGHLDQPSAPLLLINGRNDLQNATDDIYLSLEHGDPKAARVFPGGHMGEGPILPMIADWLEQRAC